MKFAVIGSQGQLGTDLVKVLEGDVVALRREDIDIAEIDSVTRCLREVQPDVVLNAAAYNFVDKAEDEPIESYRINALGPWNLAKVCDDIDCTLLHVSSDYVFSADRQRTTPWSEGDAPGPTSAYSVSKLAGEYYAQSYCSKHFVVRTCGLYGHAGRTGRGKGNFVETMLRLGQDRDQLSIVNDQRCTPTNTYDLAIAIQQLIATDAYGLYHLTNDDDMTWFEFAREIFQLAEIDIELSAISTEQFGAAADRPRYSVLSNQKANDLGIQLPSWQDAIARYLSERG